MLQNAHVFSEQPAGAAGFYYAQVGDSLKLNTKEKEEMTGLKLSGLTIRDEEAIDQESRSYVFTPMHSKGGMGYFAAGAAGGVLAGLATPVPAPCWKASMNLA